MADALQGLWPRDSVCLDVDLAELALQNGLHADSELRTFFTVTAPREAFLVQMDNGSTDASQGFLFPSLDTVKNCQRINMSFSMMKHTHFNTRS